jgi:hypothetical protein
MSATKLSIDQGIDAPSEAAFRGLSPYLHAASACYFFVQILYPFIAPRGYYGLPNTFDPDPDFQLFLGLVREVFVAALAPHLTT